MIIRNADRGIEVLYHACSRCKCDIEGNYDMVCLDCYKEKDRQAEDYLTTIRQLKACMREAIGEIDLALQGGKDGT